MPVAGSMQATFTSGAPTIHAMSTPAAPHARPLVVRCGALGDVVMITTLLRLLAARYDSEVDVLGSGAWTPPLLRHEPALGHLQLVKSRNTPYPLCPSQWALVRWLRSRGRGPVYLGDTDVGIRALLMRGGVHPDDIVARPAAQEDAPVLWPDRWLTLGMQDPVQAYPTVPVDVGRYRLPRLVVTDEDRRELAQWLDHKRLQGPLVLFQPGNKRTHKRGKLLTSDHPKHWAPENWAAIAKAVLDEHPHAHVLLCGSLPEHRVLEDIRDAAADDARVLNTAGELPIPRLLALLERAHGMVSVDTGPAHAAAALGCPLVVMFGAAPPSKWRPIGPGRIIVLGGDNGSRSRVSDLAPQDVFAAWRRVSSP